MESIAPVDSSRQGTTYPYQNPVVPFPKQVDPLPGKKFKVEPEFQSPGKEREGFVQVAQIVDAMSQEGGNTKNTDQVIEGVVTEENGEEEDEVINKTFFQKLWSKLSRAWRRIFTKKHS